MWTLHALPMSAWVHPRSSDFPLPKDTHMNLIGNHKLAVGVGVDFLICLATCPGFNPAFTLRISSGTPTDRRISDRKMDWRIGAVL